MRGASLLVRLILQNHGALSGKKRRQFAELSDEEITRIEKAIRTTNATTEIDDDLAGSDFEEFLQEREAKQNDSRTAEEILGQGAGEEWQRLKDLTRSLTAGKAVDGKPLCVDPLSGFRPGFLQLKDVAASFSDRGKRNGIPQACRIRFDRHASGPQGVFLEEKSPIPAKCGPWSREQTEKLLCGGLVNSIRASRLRSWLPR